MKITISADLTEDQLTILSSMKGYNSESGVTACDFIRSVYEGMIKSDASSAYIAYSRQQKEAERIAEEQSIRDQVENAITSSIDETVQ